MSIVRKIKLLCMLMGCCAVLLSAGNRVCAADRVQPVEDNIVIVIDPGHGGDNHGTESGQTMEKVMTLATAKAMLEELELYDNVTVYLTHSDDRSMYIKDRAKFAEDVGADFLFSIHYNASENHTLFGSEVWVSCETPYNAYGYQFGYEYLLAMQEKGLFVRGIKTRIDKGTDYYGILRESAARSIPAVIIEHCHVDEERDTSFIENEESWAEFGRMDAAAVAKYFGLKSSVLGLDYSEEATKLQPVQPEELVKRTLRDDTAPDVCAIELADCNYGSGEISLQVSAADYDSPLMYYDYSLDGGQNWSRREIWPGSDTLTGAYKDTFSLAVTVPDGEQPDIILRAYNMADLETESNVLHFDRAFIYGEDSEQETEEQTGADESATPKLELPDHTGNSIGTTTFMPAASDAVATEAKTPKVIGFLVVSLTLVICLFLIVLISQAISARKRKRKRR